MLKNIQHTQLILNKGYIKKTSNKLLSYFLIILIILYEDSPFFLLADKQIFWFILFIILLIVNKGSKRIFNKRIILVLMSVWFLIFSQFILVGGISPAALYKPVLIFYTPFLIFMLMGLKYYKYLFNVIYFIAIYTSIIYLLHTIFPPFYEWLLSIFDLIYPYSWGDWPRSILIYSAPRDSGYIFMRNSGVFHEPGAYSIYLMLAIIINTFFTKKPLNRKNIFLILVLLTTFSTTGYLMLFIFLSYVVIKLKIHYLFKPLIIIPAALLMLNIYQKSEFLQEKVQKNYQSEAEALEEGSINRGGRFYSIGISAKSIMSTPIFGRGILTINKTDVGESGRYGYGFMGLFAMYGIIFGLFYMLFFFKGFMVLSRLYNMTTFYVFIAFLIINMGLLTQVFFFHTPFIYLFILGLYTPSHLFIKKFKTVNYVKSIHKLI